MYLPQRSKASQRRAIRSEYPDAVDDRALWPGLAAALRRYFGGERVEFDVRLDTTGAGDFEATVWQVCMRVPYGTHSLRL